MNDGLPPEQQTLSEILRDLVLANRILGHQGVVDVYGHISVRHPDNPNHYFMSCSRAPALVSLDDILEFNVDGTPIDARGKLLYAERAIHGSIYAKRPDVGSVCHNHSAPLIPFGVTGTALRAIFHIGSVIGNEVPVWDIRKEFGDTSLLVIRPETGASLAKALGNNRVALLRGHGAVVVGRGVREAVYVAIQTQNNAQLQLASHSLGTPVYLSPGEIEEAGKIMLSPLSMERSWRLWAHDAGFPAG
jgi:ribulose-5-phosphate 4-epimerase/fuculose-1-phosphate aldolase